jgi:hypothetical protein
VDLRSHWRDHDDGREVKTPPTISPMASVTTKAAEGPISSPA